ncbi:hypothetical protein WR25_22365 isoform A [Diploscapter pachys]|uniref:Anillin homology domain-containing protein n=1 Tax=Diploscapter pachys TaxID=2018661 RepID=A0A2A2KNG1_9BILA|nr:hypothetical protein WR25_22365 isoform A [Diploscapter pachys]
MEPNENIDPDDILKRVLDSIEKRREELETGSGMDETKENSILMTSTHNVEIQMNAVLTTSGSNIQLKPNEEDEKVRRRSRFSEIAANQVEFEKSVGDLQKKKEVEARMPKAATVSARRRSAVLEKIEEAQKRASGSDSSSDSRKSVSNSNSDAKAVTFAAGHQRSPSHGDNAPKSTPILQNSVICLDDSAANESKDKLTPLKSASSLPSAADIWSPKPYNSATKSSGYSPILSGLTSSSRSSPKITTVWTEDAGRKSSDDLNKSIVTTETIKLSTSSPVRSTAIQPGSARKVAQLLEQKFKPAGTSSKPGTPTLPAGVQTQFRGAHCVPVVAGAKAADPTPKPKMTPGNVNQLKSRWEFVSATGTPIHPDESEDALLAAARRMQEKVPFKPRTFGRIANPGKNAGFKESSASSHSREASSGDEREQERREQHTEIEKNEPGKPASSLALFNGSVSPISKAEEAKEAELEDEVFELEHPVGSGQHKLDDHNTSRMIDEAFGFMGTYDSPTSHLSRSPIKQTIFENEFGNMQGSPMQGSSLPYTISFYRKMAKEMHEDQNAEKIDLNAQMSTSSLNTNQAMAYSSPMKDGAKKVDVAKLRMFLEKELMAQEERISQATRALAYCQERPEFAGSREEVDAQRACLIATETFNVLRNSLLQLETGKRKKIMGPLGELTFRSIVIRLDQNYNFHPNPMEIYYFLVLIRCGDLVEASKIVSSDEALRNELRMDFALGHRVTLNNLQPDFEAFLDIYCLVCRDSVFSS